MVIIPIAVVLIAVACFIYFRSLEKPAFRGMCSLGHIDQVKKKLSSNPSLIESRDNHGLMPIHCAVLRANDNDCEMIRLLIDHGADVNARDIKGTTPLMIATMNNNPRTVETLLSAGADPNAPDNSGVTPLSFSKMNEAVHAVYLRHMNT